MKFFEDPFHVPDMIFLQGKEWAEPTRQAQNYYFLLVTNGNLPIKTFRSQVTASIYVCV